MLSRVRIQNFKSIGEPGVDLELKPLTFLVGPNGGGKSSILEAIGVTAQGSPTGRAANLPTWEGMVHKLGGSNPIAEVYFSHDEGLSLGYRFRPDISEGGVSIQTSHVPRHDGMIDSLVSTELQLKTFFVSSNRGIVPNATSTDSDPPWVGIHGEHLVLLLAKIFSRREYDEVAGKIASWAGRFGINGLKAGIRGSNTAGSDYQDSELETALNLVLSSSGAKQILTVITQLFWAPTGSLIMIEEPEISLHPKAQIDVPEMFAEAIKEDKQ
ncbi:MAG: AAA family ATPase, partial [Dehalococcoidia bacterium]